LRIKNSAIKVIEIKCCESGSPMSTGSSAAVPQTKSTEDKDRVNRYVD